MAETAAALICDGAGKSGKPSARLTALLRSASNDNCWIGDGFRDLATVDSLSSMVFLNSYRRRRWCGMNN